MIIHYGQFHLHLYFTTQLDSFYTKTLRLRVWRDADDDRDRVRSLPIYYPMPTAIQLLLLRLFRFRCDHYHYVPITNGWRSHTLVEIIFRSYTHNNQLRYCKHQSIGRRWSWWLRYVHGEVENRWGWASNQDDDDGRERAGGTKNNKIN
jgi:hypothetical protein